MDSTFINLEESPCFTVERDVLSVFKQNQEKPDQIHQGMTPIEIADFVSDHLIGVIKQQFDIAKQEFLTSNK
jgi:hypothetical protein